MEYSKPRLRRMSDAIHQNCANGSSASSDGTCKEGSEVNDGSCGTGVGNKNACAVGAAAGGTCNTGFGDGSGCSVGTGAT